MFATCAGALKPLRLRRGSETSAWSYRVIWPESELHNLPPVAPTGSGASSPSAFKQAQIRQQEVQPSESAFDRLSLMEEERRAALCSEIAVLNHPWAERLAHRMRSLLDATREGYPDEALISVSSLQSFLRFLKQTDGLDYPDTTISANGNIRAEWKTSDTRHLAVEFLTATKARFAIIGPDPQFPSKVAQVAGGVSADSILKAVEPYRAFEWVIRNAG